MEHDGKDPFFQQNKTFLASLEALTSKRRRIEDGGRGKASSIM